MYFVEKVVALMQPTLKFQAIFLQFPILLKTIISIIPNYYRSPYHVPIRSIPMYVSVYWNK